MTDGPRRGWRLFRERLRRHRLAVWSLWTLAAVAAACVAAPWIVPYGFAEIDLTSIRQAPSLAHPMGTDDLGRDLLTRILHGGRLSLLIGVLSAGLATGLGSAIGAVAGYYGRRVDSVLMRLTDVAFAIPTLPLLILLASFTDATAASMAVVIGLLSWMGTARVVRGEVLSIKETVYIEAARGLGAPPGRIIVRHVLPNALGPIVVAATLAVGNAIVLESSLSFLGLGVDASIPTWGNMLEDARATMATKPWLTVFPGLAILVTVLAVNFVGDGLQDALDPAQRASA